MKKLATAAIFFASMGLMALPALADTYTVNFTGVGGQSTAGVYVYPYNFTVTNNTTSVSDTVAMMCIDFEREIFIPETWQANLVNITSNPLPGDALSHSNLEALAVLDSEIVGATGSALSDLQFAAWTLTASNADMTTGPYAAGFTTGAAADLLAAQQDVSTGTTSASHSGVVYADYSYFDPTSWPAGDGAPQRFLIDTAGPNIGPLTPPVNPVPEPSSLMLLGTGVVGAAGLFRRRFARS